MRPEPRAGAGRVGESAGRIAQARTFVFLPRDRWGILAGAADTLIGLVVVAGSRLAVAWIWNVCPLRALARVRRENVATPLTALTVSVPWSFLPPCLPARAMVTLPL